MGNVGRHTCIHAFIKLETRLGDIVSEDLYCAFFILMLSKVPSQTTKVKRFIIVGILLRKNTKIAPCVDYAFSDVWFYVAGKITGCM